MQLLLGSRTGLGLQLGSASVFELKLPLQLIVTGPLISLPGQSPVAGSPIRAGAVAPETVSGPEMRVPQIEIAPGASALTGPAITAPFE